MHAVIRHRRCIPRRGSGCLRTSPQPFEVEPQLISTWYAILVSGDIQYGVELSQSSPERRIPKIVGHASNGTEHPPVQRGLA
jgi:hypothetical protein